VARRSNPARLVLALSVAAVLAVFLVYVSFAGGGTPAIQPSELDGRTETVSLGGVVVSQRGDEYGRAGKRIVLRDVKGPERVAVVYRGTIPDQFKVGRELMVKGALRNGVFVAQRDSMVTKCPSKYESAKSSS
jgi:cytochrome c-type biogenesis protein CcmE